MRRVIALGFAAALTIGCATAHVSPVVPLACPEGGLNPVANVAAKSVYPPVPHRFFLPPLPPPPDVRGHRMMARLVVDSTGSLVRDSITVCGLQNSNYQQKVIEALARLSFEPAHRDGVPVRSPIFIAFQF